MRSIFRLSALAIVAATMAISCTDSSTATQSTATMGRIGLAPSFTPAAARAFGELSAFGIEVTTVRIQLVAPDGSTRDTTIAFPVGMDTLHVDLSVPLRSAGQSFRADL